MFHWVNGNFSNANQPVADLHAGETNQRVRFRSARLNLHISKSRRITRTGISYDAHRNKRYASRFNRPSKLRFRAIVRKVTEKQHGQFLRHLAVPVDVWSKNDTRTSQWLAYVLAVFRCFFKEVDRFCLRDSDEDKKWLGEIFVTRV